MAEERTSNESHLKEVHLTYNQKIGKYYVRLKYSTNYASISHYFFIEKGAAERILRELKDL